MLLLAVLGLVALFVVIVVGGGSVLICFVCLFKLLSSSLL